MSVLQKLITKFNMNKNRELYIRIVKEIQQAESLWIAFSEKSNNYFLGNEQGSAAAYVFSEKEYYAKYYEHMLKKGKQINVTENPVEYRMTLFADLYRSGFDSIVIDNGQTYLKIGLFDIIKKPEINSKDKQVSNIVNPELVRAANFIFQENSQENIDERLWEVLFSEIFRGEYIIPANTQNLKLSKKSEREFNITDDSKIAFPVLENNDGKKYYPFFTDWNEYRKFDRETKYTIMSVGFKDMERFIDKASGIVINPFGANIIINYNMLSAIADNSKNFHKEKSEMTFSDPADDPENYPLEMVRKISEKLWDKESVRAAYLKIMVRNGKESYLVAIEGKLPENPQELYNEIAENALPSAKNIPIDFVDFSSDFARKIFTHSQPFYKAK